MAKTSYDVPAARKAVRLIELLCDSEEPLGISDIGQRLGLNKNMSFRLVRTLLQEGWLVQAEGQKYRMGLRPFHYTSKPVARMGLRTAADGPLRDLWQATGESAYLVVPDGDEMIVLDHFDSTRDVRIAAKVGARYELHCTAPGKALLAFADRALLARLSEARLSRLTEQTICDPAELEAHLEEVRRQGYALDLEEYADGLICFAAPVFDYRACAVGAIGISVLTLHYTPEKMVAVLGPHVLSAARAVSATLGYAPQPFASVVAGPA